MSLEGTDAGGFRIPQLAKDERKGQTLGDIQNHISGETRVVKFLIDVISEFAASRII